MSLHILFSVADPGSGIRCLSDPLWKRDPGWIKSQDPEPGCGMRDAGSGMNNQDHIS